MPQKEKKPGEQADGSKGTKKYNGGKGPELFVEGSLENKFSGGETSSAPTQVLGGCSE